MIDDPYVTRILGLYPPGPGEGLSRKHDPCKFPKKDPNNRRLRYRIGDEAVRAYADAMRAIDERLDPL